MTSAPEQPGSSLLRPRRPSTLVLVAVVLFGFAVRTNAPGTGLATFIAIALLGVSLWISRGEFRSEPINERHMLLAVLVFSTLGLVGWATTTVGDESYLLTHLPGLVWAIFGVSLFVSSSRGFVKAHAIGLIVGVVTISGLLGVFQLRAVDGIGFDVHLFHVEAAQAIASGQNPYGDAVAVPDGSPLAKPGDEIVGYPYPPVVAIGYSVGEWAFGDPRYVSLGSWLLVLTLLGWLALRYKSRQTLYLMILLAALPGWPMVLRVGWTEPLSLALLAYAFFAWKNSTRSGVGLGLALASKQYFLLGAPVLALHRDETWLRRAIIGIAMVGVTVGAALVIDFDAFWSSAVEFHSQTAPRVDSSNLVGLLGAAGVEISPPTVLSVVVGLLVGVAASLRSRTAHSFMLAIAIALAASFFVSSQAFANYWYLVVGLCVLSVTTPVEADDT